MPAGPMSFPIVSRLAGAAAVVAGALALTGVAASADTGGAAYGTTPPARAHAASDELEKIADCESGGDPTAVSKGGQYRGKYQFDRPTWRGLGGTGDPARASEAEQDRRAAILLQRSGSAAWPNCA